MRLRGRIFDGSDSLCTIHQVLVKHVGHAVLFTEFTPAKIYHLGFVNRLLHTFCEVDICCALVNAYPSYIAGFISVFSAGGTRLSLLYIARINFHILDNICNRYHPFNLALSRSS